jgi:hypothetical protein
MGCSLRLIEVGKSYHPISAHLTASRLTSLHHRPLKSQPSIPLTQCVKRNDQSQDVKYMDVINKSYVAAKICEHHKPRRKIGRPYRRS